MKKIALDKAPTRVGTDYPPPLDEPCATRTRTKLGDAAGLTQFGVNLLRLPAGTWSAQRHWHHTEDEFVYVLEGEPVLVTDSGEEKLGPGDCVGFKAGVKDGHHIQNRSDKEAVLLEVGTRNPKGDGVVYPDVDLDLHLNEEDYRHKDGTPY